MKNAQQIYNALLYLYPRSYRKAFGAQMMQTFRDQYQDVEKSEGRVCTRFWLSAIADEIKNIATQHLTGFREGAILREVTASKVITSAVLLIPLYVVFYAALVNIALAVPHPHLSGIGVLIALGGLFLLPGAFSIMAGCALASTFASVFPRRKGRTA